MDLTNIIQDQSQKAASLTSVHRYKELQVLQQGGQIAQLVWQPSLDLTPRRVQHWWPTFRIYYIADLAYTDRSTGQGIVEVARSTQSTSKRIKRCLVSWLYGITVRQA